MDANTVTLERALNETRTGDIWLFRGGSRPDRAIQAMTNAPVNHVGMTVAIDDLPPLMWHAELGDKLHRHVDGHQPPRCAAQRRARQAVERWMQQLRAAVLAASAHAVRDPRAGGPGAAGHRADGRHAVPHHRAADGALVSRPGSDGQRLDPRNPVLGQARFASRLERRKAEQRNVGLETAYCAETVAITYEEMGLLTTEKHYSWFDPGKFWSGDSLPLTEGYQLSDEIAVVLG